MNPDIPYSLLGFFPRFKMVDLPVTSRELAEQFLTAAREEEERENQLLSTRILEGLVKIALEIAKAEGFTLILEKSGSGVIFYEEPMDITEQVVKIYNERNQAGE